MSFSFQHSLPPSAYATVKAYPNFDADRDAAALETAIKTKGEHQGLGLPFHAEVEGWFAKKQNRTVFQHQHFDILTQGFLL